MSTLFGPAVKDTNIRLRIYFLIFGGIIAFAAILQWRASLLLAEEYVDLPNHPYQEKYKQEIN